MRKTFPRLIASCVALGVVTLVGTRAGFAAVDGHLGQLTFEADALSEASSSTGTCTRDVVNCMTGTGCFRFNPSSAGCSVVKSGLDQAELRVSAWIRVASTPSSATKLIALQTTGGNGSFIKLNTDRTLGLFRAGDSTPCQSTSTTLPLGVPMRLEYRTTINGAAGSLQLRVFSSLGVVEDLTCTNQSMGSSNLSQVVLGDTGTVTLPRAPTLPRSIT